jgi:hypothetical protein
MKLNLKNSIYSKGYTMGSGLDVEKGRLINNRPDGMTGIAKAAEVKKAMKQAEKVSMIADGVSLGYLKAEILEGSEKM